MSSYWLFYKNQIVVLERSSAADACEYLNDLNDSELAQEHIVVCRGNVAGETELNVQWTYWSLKTTGVGWKRIHPYNADAMRLIILLLGDLP